MQNKTKKVQMLLTQQELYALFKPSWSNDLFHFIFKKETLNKDLNRGECIMVV